MKLWSQEKGTVMGMFFLMVRKPTKKTPLMMKAWIVLDTRPGARMSSSRREVSARVGLPA